MKMCLEVESQRIRSIQMRGAPGSVRQSTLCSTAPQIRAPRGAGV